MSLMVLVMNLATVAFASGNDEKEAKFVEKVKSEVAKLGTGTDAKVQVKLKDGTKLKGYISEANDKQFVVVDSKGRSTAVPYPQVNHFSRKAIGWLVVIGLVVTLVVITASVKD